MILRLLHSVLNCEENQGDNVHEENHTANKDDNDTENEEENEEVNSKGNVLHNNNGPHIVQLRVHLDIVAYIVVAGGATGSGAVSINFGINV